MTEVNGVHKSVHILIDICTRFGGWAESEMRVVVAHFGSMSLRWSDSLGLFSIRYVGSAFKEIILYLAVTLFKHY